MTRGDRHCRKNTNRATDRNCGKIPYDHTLCLSIEENSRKCMSWITITCLKLSPNSRWKEKDVSSENVRMTKTVVELQRVALCVMICQGRSHMHETVGPIDRNIITVDMTTISLHCYTSRISRPRECQTACRESWTRPSTAFSLRIFSPCAKEAAVVSKPRDCRWTGQGRTGAWSKSAWGIICHAQENNTVIRLAFLYSIEIFC